MHHFVHHVAAPGLSSQLEQGQDACVRTAGKQAGPPHAPSPTETTPFSTPTIVVVNAVLVVVHRNIV